MKATATKPLPPPQYHLFMDSAYAIAEKVELITPARFLFNAGSTPKSWNQKMLNDEHLKVESYEPDASKVFPDTDIKGGVAITYRDDTKTSEQSEFLQHTKNSIVCLGKFTKQKINSI